MCWFLRSLVIAVCLLPVSSQAFADDKTPAVRFDRDVLPILAENCFKCHGPDEKVRKAKLRLDTKAGIERVVKPGKSGESEIIRRINARPDDGGMPPPKSDRHLTAAQKETLRRWVAEGAKWSAHWAFRPPIRRPLPKVSKPGWCRNGIDYFILARLDKERLAPSPEAGRATLFRRVSLDLTGLPPSMRELDQFLADHSPNAYEKAVDRLLAKSQYGERMAQDWLDEARYADTNGYQNDFARTMWPWRDWVIDAFNRNEPFDRFMIEQLAGDLLPSPTLKQRIATGFNRNNRTVTEAGSIDEEWRVENAVDRVETTATVFLGLTMGCCRCHDHKFDPISQKEFYQFFAFFNSLNERGVYTETRGNVPPLVSLPTKENRERLKQFDVEIAEAEKVVKDQEKLVAQRQKKWEAERAKQATPPEPKDWAFRCALAGDLSFQLPGGKSGSATYRGKKSPVWSEGPLAKALRLDGQGESFVDAGQAIGLEPADRFSYGAWFKPAGSGTILSKMDDNAGYRGFDFLFNNDKLEVHLVHQWPDNAIKVSTKDPLPKNLWTHAFVTYDGSSTAAGVKIYVNGRPVPVTVENDHLHGGIANTQPLRLGKRSTAFSLNGELADVRIYRRTLTPEEVRGIAEQPLEVILKSPKRTKTQQELLRQFAQATLAAELNQAKQKIAALKKEKSEYERQIPTVMVMADTKTPRPTYVLKRGQYDHPDKEQNVNPGVPSCLSPMTANTPHNRLGLAEWLASPANPLTARVTVNRYWQHYFGTGIVKTAENFGRQCEPPSHPELLDWLATEFIRTGWDIKAMQRLIVTSAAYRQSSNVTPELEQRDPENRLLARGPRFRLSAEVVRDNALAISGLLVEKVGGPSIKPYQPAGLWEELAGGAARGPMCKKRVATCTAAACTSIASGPCRTRRWQPSTHRRGKPARSSEPRTNTPLQALELLNDVTYVEAARNLGQLMLSKGRKSPPERIAYAFRRATARTPSAEELNLLVRGLERYQREFAANPESAKHFLRHGDSPVDAKHDPAELAAYAATASVILNLDETITKE